MHAARLATRLNIVPAGILLAIAGSFGAMILLTAFPSSTILWAVNIEATRMFGDSFYVIADMAGLGVVESALVLGLAGVITLALGPRSSVLRFAAAHVAAALVSLPVVRALAAAGQESAAFAGTAGLSWFDMVDVSDVDAVRLPLIATALTCCLVLHVEMIQRIRRDAAVRARARRLLGR